MDGTEHTLVELVPGRVSVHVNLATERALRGGQLWLFQEGVTKVRGTGAPGDVAVLYGTKDRPFALGLYDPASPIRVRVLHVGASCTVDGEFFQKRVREASAQRLAWFQDDTNGYRVIHGPGDGLPGLVVDRYDQTLVLKLYSSAWIPWLPTIQQALVEVFSPQRVVLRLNRQLQDAPALCHGYTEGQILYGEALLAPLSFRENGVVFECDPVLGQKTGFFLDQRENRERVERLAAGKRTLNVFSYTGGFSLYAARGGAGRVVSVDASRPAMDALERNIALNAAEPAIARTEFVNHCGDAFEVFQQLQSTRETFGVVIVDPPAFARKAAEVEGALRAYRRLARLAVPLVDTDGVLVFASCSSRITPDAFRGAIEAGTNEAGFYLDVFGESGHPVDHPIANGELQYLKCLYATLRPLASRPKGARRPSAEDAGRSGQRSKRRPSAGAGGRALKGK